MTDSVASALIGGGATIVAALLTLIAALLIQVKRDTRKVGNGFTEEVFAEFRDVHEKLDRVEERQDTTDDRLTAVETCVQEVKNALIPKQKTRKTASNV